MAAQDNKISGNRRRLFKALSAAPVVMTLRPGSALANASAYQCVTKIVNPAPENRVFSPSPGCDPLRGETCFAHMNVMVGDASRGVVVNGACANQVLENANEEVGELGFFGHRMSVLVDAAPVGLTEIRIVEIQPGLYYDETSGRDISAFVEIQEENNTYRLLSETSADLCIENIPRVAGSALLIGEVLEINGQHSFQTVGVYPQAQLDGDNTGITESCLASIPSAVDPNTFARG